MIIGRNPYAFCLHHIRMCMETDMTTSIRLNCWCCEKGSIFTTKGVDGTVVSFHFTELLIKSQKGGCYF